MHNRIDHVVIGANTLERGQAELARFLGVTVPRGGRHAAMSTHNCVMQTGDETFLEIIAIDPAAGDPGRVRWFSLDEETVRTRLAERPRALCWVAGTDDLDGVVAASPVDLGEVVDLARDDLTWRLTVPRDGRLPGDGLLPAFIEWPPGPHPSAGQQDKGVRLERIVLTSPEPERLAGMLKALRVDRLARIERGPTPGLAFELTGPKGRVRLD